MVYRLGQLVQQWLSTSGRSKNLVVVQSMMLDDSQLFFNIHWNFKELGSNASEGMNLLLRASKQA